MARLRKIEKGMRFKVKDFKKLKKSKAKAKRKYVRILQKTVEEIEPLQPNSRGVMAGYRPDIIDCTNKKLSPKGIYFRSSWEANYARYLNFLMDRGQIQRWEYEPHVFWFEEIKRGVRSYLPDFKVWETINDEPYYVEVKGFMDAKSKTKLKRMAKYYPEVKLVLVDKDKYNEIKYKLSSLIKNWEHY